jgi:hypothetical protein
MAKTLRILSTLVVLACVSTRSLATVVNFTGGTVTRLDATTQTTNNSVTWDNVDFYEEAGFRLDFLSNSGSAGFATHIGDYYGVGNDVIHAHWATGGLGQVTSIEITKVGGGTFDLNYFLVTSNTALGPNKPALGNELTYVEGFNSNVSTGPAVLLPPEGWGFPASAVTLGSAFDAVDKVVFFVNNTVDCFGMDEFYINEPAPTVPEPNWITMLSLAGASLGAIGWRRKGKADSRQPTTI